MFKFVLIAIALSAVSAHFGLNAGTYSITRTNAACLRTSNNITRVAVELLNERGSWNTNFITAFIYLRDANITNVDAIVKVSDSYDPEQTCNNISRALPAAFNGTLWLSVDTGSWTKDIGMRVSYLESLALTCKGRGIDTGIYSKVTSWTLIMGSPTAGSDKLRALPVWYYNDNGNADFNDFRYAGFGKWAKASMKEYKNSPSLCSGYFNGLEFY